VHVIASFWCEPDAFCRGFANPTGVWISAAFVSAGTVESAGKYGLGWPISCSSNVAAFSLSCPNASFLTLTLFQPGKVQPGEMTA